MIKNYFKTAWRNLTRGKGFSVINIAGLVIGMTGATLIFLWLQNEISFDKFHVNKDNLYQVYGLTDPIDGKSNAINVTSQPLGPALKQTYPEVQATTRAKDISNLLLTVDNRSFVNVEGSFVDPTFLQMFSFPLVQGRPNEQLKNVSSISITERLAKRLFGTEYAIGKIIKIDSVDNFTVTGILKDLPANTRFTFDYLLPWDYVRKLGAGFVNDDWVSNNTPTYVLLMPGTNPTVFSEKMKNISRVNAGRNDIWTHFLFPLKDWHLYANFENGKPSGGRIETVRVFAIIAIFILLIACINFMNLSTARSEKRAKEVGIRKVAGAGKGLLIGQFIAEAILTVFIAEALSLLLVQLALPSFNLLVGVSLIIPYNNAFFWLAILVFIVFTGLLAGSYPAFYLSSFQPVSIFRKQFKKSQSIISPRKVLVVLQFTFAIILIISTIVIRNQVVYAQDRDKGYSHNDLLRVGFMGDIEKNYALIKSELINNGIAASVTKTMTGIVKDGYRTWGLRWSNENPKDTTKAIIMFGTDADLVTTTGIKLINGRDIDINKYPTDSFAVLLNETAVKTMGFKDPVGQVIRNPFENVNWHVVGVVKDYVTSSPYDEIPPIIIMGPGGWFNTMYIKFRTGQPMAGNLASAEKIFKKYNPAYPFDYRFVDQEYANQFDSEQRTKTLAGLFATLAIFISCLGLFGLSAYVAESRIKEIGVRKVLGASVVNITRLLSIDFVKLVLVSLLIGSPIAWWAMSKWLEGYNYRISLGWSTFLVAGLLALAIALLTVSFQSVKAAVANPLKNLRTE